jgi:hypothetical protein
MPKTLTCDGKGLLGSNSTTRILPQSPTKNQVVSEISNYISSGALTNALEFLEKRGITGDVALFLVANLQLLGRWEA